MIVAIGRLRSANEGYSVNTPLTLETENTTIDFSSTNNFCPNTNSEIVDNVSFCDNNNIKIFCGLIQILILNFMVLHTANMYIGSTWAGHFFRVIEQQ